MNVTSDDGSTLELGVLCGLSVESCRDRRVANSDRHSDSNHGLSRNSRQKPFFLMICGVFIMLKERKKVIRPPFMYDEFALFIVVRGRTGARVILLFLDEHMAEFQPRDPT